MKNLLMYLPLILMMSACGADATGTSGCPPPDHSAWTALLAAHVDGQGTVDYKGFKDDSVRLRSYCKLLSDCSPDTAWTRNQRLAYWINAYNAFTVLLITEHYPVSSIKDIKRGIPFINSVWDLKFFSIGGKKMDLNGIEHSILRKTFAEPRIHFAIVCASLSCPMLLNTAYLPDSLDLQLERQAKRFINDPKRNSITAHHAELSSIFNWFKGDFTKQGTLIDFINLYAEDHVDETATIDYSDYDWNLNGH